MKIDVTQQHVDMMAETMFAAFCANVPGAAWVNEPEAERQNWRRAARATIRLLASMPMEIRITQ